MSMVLTSARRLESRLQVVACILYLEREIEEIVSISINIVKSVGFDASCLKTQFPKKCNNCGQVYLSFDEFYRHTTEITDGTVSYPILGSDFYLHRNCSPPCETTLLVIFANRRDQSHMGVRRRKLFETCINHIQKTLRVTQKEAYVILRDELALKLNLNFASHKDGFSG